MKIKGILTPIPNCSIEWKNWKKIAIYENGERLININVIDNSKINVYPIYYIKKFPGSIKYCLLRESLVNKFSNIIKKLPYGFKLVLLDGWRPHKVQKSLFNYYKNILMKKHPGWNSKKIDNEAQLYSAKPSSNDLTPSPHFTGGSIDMTLEYDGNFLDMGTLHDDSSILSKTNAFEKFDNSSDTKTKMIIKNRRILYNLMISEGFSNYSNEWWHYDYGNQLWGLKTNNNAFYKGIDFI